MVKVDSDYYRRRAEVPVETFAVAHPSGCRRHLPFTRSWVTTGLHRHLRPPLTISTWCMELADHVPTERYGRPRPYEGAHAVGRMSASEPFGGTWSASGVTSFRIAELSCDPSQSRARRTIYVRLVNVCVGRAFWHRLKMKKVTPCIDVTLFCFLCA